MKILVANSLVVLLALSIRAQVQPDNQDGSTPNPPLDSVQQVGPPGQGVYAITEAGAHHRRWSKITQVRQEDGSFRNETSSYIEMASGLNRRDENQRWVPAEARFEVINGAAVARTTANQVILTGPGDILPLDVVTPQGVRLSSRVLGISYYSPKFGRSVMLAEVKAVQGKLIPPNQVVYENALEGEGGFRANLSYRLTLSGLEQDLTILEQPPAPTDLGMPDDPDMRLEVITEFLNAPQPAVTESILRRTIDPAARAQMEEPDFIDQTLSLFGELRMGHGVAFDLGEAKAGPGLSSIPTGKRWQVVNGRNVLFEAIELKAAQPFLAKLPIREHAAIGRKAKPVLVASRDRLLPQLKPPQQAEPILITQNSLPKKGFNIDYTASLALNNWVFLGDETYFVTNAVSLSGTTILEGGAVIKFERDNPPAYNVWLWSDGPVLCKTDRYHPVMLTARDDNSLGAILPTSNGNPTGTYALYNLLVNSSVAVTLEHIQSHWSWTPLELYYGSGHIVRDFVTAHSGYGAIINSAAAAFRNVLIDSPSWSAFGGFNSTVTVENATIRDMTQFLYDYYPGSFSLMLTNSIVAGTGIINSTSGWTNSYGLTTNSSAGLFQSVGGASNYLAVNSPYRNAGTTNIDAQLLAALKQKTTYPPILLTNPITASVTLSSQIPRNTGLPDLGFSYEPLDYLISNLALTNVTLTLTNGVAIGYYGNYGITLYDGAKLISEGLPTALNRLVRYRTVQESPISLAEFFSHTIICSGSCTPMPEVELRLTELSLLASHNTSTQIYTPYSGTMRVTLQDSQLRGGWLMAYTPAGLTLNVTNCLFERVSGLIVGDSVVFYNNTFFGGTEIFSDGPGQSYTVMDNLFDQTILSNGSSGVWSLGNNGYTSGYSRLAPNSVSDVILSSSPSYERGPFGTYYLPNGIALIDRGSRLASAAGLYHYTTQTAPNSSEAETQVDIGFHVPAANSAGEPCDRDGDGASDVVEDRNGNGVYDSGDLSDWSTSNSPVAGAAALQVFTPLR